jgi:antitoxin component of MazEF toxin-antitoxin module
MGLMVTVRLRRVGNSVVITLPSQILDSAHLAEDQTVSVEVGDGAVIIRPWDPDAQAAWQAYTDLEPRYRNANRKLAD